MQMTDGDDGGFLLTFDVGVCQNLLLSMLVGCTPIYHLF